MRRTMSTYNAPTRKSGIISHDPLKAVVDYALHQGMPTGRVENLIGMPIDFANQPKLLPSITGPLLFSQILDHGVGSAPPLEVAANAPFSFFGGLERAVSLAPNGLDALRAFSRNFSIFHTGLIPEVETTNKHVTFSFRYIGDEMDNGACNEVVLSVLLRLMRLVFGQYGQPCEVRLRYSKNGTTRAYEDFFMCKVTLGSSDQSFGLVYRKSDMEWAQQGSDPAVFSFAMERLHSVAKERSQHTHQTAYLELINSTQTCAREGVFKTAQIASVAGFSERKAQRLAKQHGTSLRELVYRTRLQLLNDLLSRSPEMTSEELSDALGFSDLRAFRRALKSWTGQPLTDFRARFRDEAAG
ncbi:MAG: helix-turn-helix domain-containing protein [Pseudomonadota bacterium]